MCECCDNVTKRSVKGSVEQTKIKGTALDVRIFAVAPEPRVPRTSVAASHERAGTAVEEAAAL